MAGTNHILQKLGQPVASSDAVDDDEQLYVEDESMPEPNPELSKQHHLQHENQLQHQPEMGMAETLEDILKPHHTPPLDLPE